jgi:autotransporter strand-loop-strand O-heptosyltransferase
MKKSKIKLLYLTPHLSTGGMPQFVLKRIQELQKHKDQIEIFLVEYSQFSNTYVVQRDKIIDLLGEGHFFSLGDTTDTKRKYELIDIIKTNNIDIVHSEEMLEGFESFNKIPLPLLNQLYSNDRTWKIVETCHNVWFNPQTHKKFNPEAYCFVTPYHLKETFLNETPMKFLSLYPIENKVTKILEEYEIYGDFNQVPLIRKIVVREELGLDMFKTHVLNVGLWTSGKNQGEGVEVARELIESNPDIQFHFIGNQAPNFEDYWGPIMKDLPSNVKVWGERNDVEKFMTACDVLMFNSTWECNPLVVRESINYGMKILARDLPQYMGMFDGYITPIEGDVKTISKQLVELIENKDGYKIPDDNSFGEDLLNFYNAVTNINITQNKPLTKDYTFVRHYVTQPYFEVQGTTENKLNIKYYDDKNEISYQNELPINSWVKLNKEYFIKWRTTVEENGEVIYDETLDLKDKRVYISFGSKSLGDTMAWIPYCEVFRKKHGCKLIVSTFLNSLFKDQYPDIEFVEPGDLVTNIHAQYRLGWHYTSEGVYDKNKHPFDFKKIPLQKTATDILGLDYEEVRPLLKLPNTPKKKKVGIGFHSTAQSKYWNNPDGWQAVVDYLNNLGYECMIYSKEGDGYMNNHYPKGVTIFKGGNLQEVINDLSECEFFIGLGSGLSWLAWACKLPVVLISGFSEKWAETTLDTYRVINESVCHGCFNSDRLDAGDWNWCPLHKNTDRMFECTKQISSDMVIKEINKIINKESNSDLVTIILSHANTKEKRKILIEHLKTINTKILLSTNYPIDDEIKVLCDYVIYDEENPILLKEDFNKYNVSWNFYRFEEGVEVREPFDYEHGYAVYKLIQNGLTESKKLGFKYSHIINYDYLINENTLQDNYKLLENYDSVFYIYQDSYCTGFFTGKIDELIKPFTHYNTKDEYYNYDGTNKILEIITRDAVKKQNLKVKELFYEDLKETSIVNRVVDDHKNNKNNKKIMEEKIDEVSFDRGGKDNWYSDTTIQEIENDKLIQTMEGFDYSTVNNRCLFDDGVIVDVGCLNWDWSNFFLGKKRVIGIDPFEKQIPFTELFKGVISNYNGTTKMKFSNEASTIINQSEGETVQVRTWGHFCNEYNIKKISVLKINIEGSEYDLLDSLTDDDFNNIDQIAISFHDWMIPEWKPKTERAIRILKSKNYEIQKINDSWGWYLAVKNKSTQEKIMKENEFKKISDYYNCDKTSTHTYHNVYSKIFEGIRDEVFSLLEIGIHEGSSLNVWRDYLKNANIYGLDINREFSHDRGHIFKGDQNNLFDLEKITSEIKSCKVIIDDASHNPQHQIKTFNYLFENLLEDGGYYIIEDVETSYWNPLSELYGYEIGYLNVVDYFSKLTHNVNYKYNGFDNTLKIESILFTSNCIVIKKLMK